MASEKTDPGERLFSKEACCGRILDRYRDTIEVRKDHVAIANLVRIIDATLKLANKKGFHATSLRDLAKASGMSMGGLYAYFANKTMLLSMILGEVTETPVMILKAPPDSLAADPRAHLKWIIETHLRVTEAMAPWFVLAFMEAKSFPPQDRRIAIVAEAGTEGIIANVLERGAAEGVFADRNISLTASIIKPLLQDWYVKRAKYRKRGVTVDDYIDAVIALVETPLVTGAAAGGEIVKMTDRVSASRSGRATENRR